MIYRLTQEITITTASGSFLVEGMSSFEMESTWRNFTDVANIVVSRRIRSEAERNALGLEDQGGLFEPGNRITVKAGYYPDLHTVFEGYITNVVADFPIRLRCENLMYVLKQGEVTLNEKNKTVKEVLDKCFDQLLEGNFAEEIAAIKSGANIVDANLGDIITVGGKAPFMSVLDTLRKTYKIYCFIQNGVFQSVLGGPRLSENRPFSTHEINHECDFISHDLVFETKDQKRIKIVYKGMYPDDNKKIEGFVGDAFGEVRTLVYYNVKKGASDAEKKAALEQLAQSEIDKFKYDGYRGGFTTWFAPFIKHGDRIDHTYNRVPSNDGQYQVDKVAYSFGQGGGRQKVQLGYKTGNL